MGGVNSGIGRVAGASASASVAPIDLVLFGGNVITMDDARRRVDALWLRGDRIAAVGRRAEVEAQAPSAARRIDLVGATVLPGFIDAHCHIGAIAYLLATIDCGPEAAPTIPALLDNLRAAAVSWRPEGGWVTGHSFAENLVAERRFPTRDELDAAVPNQPCVVYHRSMHACILNTPALRAVGLDTHEDPPFGKLGRDAHGRPIGTVYEAPMFELFAQTSGAFLGGLDYAAKARQVSAAAELFLSEGVTTVMDADLAGLGGLEVLRDVDAAGALPLRVSMMVNDRDAGRMHAEGVLRSPGAIGADARGRLRTTTIKVFSDGGMSSRTAAVHREFQVPPYGRGVLFKDLDEMIEIIRRAEDWNVQVAVHSQGDRAIETVLDAFETVIGRRGPAGNANRHRIEHGGMLMPHLIERAAQIGIHVVSQPGFFSTLADGWLEAYGEETHVFYPFASLREAGLRVGGSSDAPVITPNVRAALRDAVLRTSARGVVVGDLERLTIDEALELYTRDAAYLCHVDAEVGTLEPGKFADLVILASDPTAMSPAEIPGIAIRQTVVGGRPAFGEGPIPTLPHQASHA
jgi:predicted amidohydrolase YtcJ